jgi:hypothetical protein
MTKGSWLSGPGKRFEMVLEAFEGRCYSITLIRGPLWPDDGDDPPSFGSERSLDGIIETSKGDFSCTDHLASHFGCIIDYESVRSIDSN